MKPFSIHARKQSASTLMLTLLLLMPAFAFAELPTPTYGWNLGNTLEPPSGEGTWGPAATQELINAVADAGFNVIRLPVAWDSHANQSTHQIDPAWMARVKQVVDWCYAKNLTVIVNCHWDGGWLENNIGDTVNPTIDAKMKSYWTQIATAFAGYDDRLLFAGANEPNCDTAAEWATLRSYYNTFISAVRGTGGNNATRWLVVQGPNTNIDLSDQLVTSLPDDSTPGRLVFEIHFYPFQWTIMAKDESWGKMFYFWGQGYHSATMLDRNSTWGEEAYTDEQFRKMAAKFVSKGVPVIVGEWGAMKRTGYPDLTGTELNRHLASRTYFSKYVTDTANALGLKPIWWDAGGTGSNTMWLFDRSTAAMIDPDNVNALTGGRALPPPGAGLRPSAPSGLTATASSYSQVELTWADNSTNEEGFELDQATNSTFTNGLIIGTVSANRTSITFGALSASTTYYFRIRAFSGGEFSEYSTASVTTPALTLPAPLPPPSGGNAGGGGGGGAPSAWFLGVLALATLVRSGKGGAWYLDVQPSRRVRLPPARVHDFPPVLTKLIQLSLVPFRGRFAKKHNHPHTRHGAVFRVPAPFAGDAPAVPQPMKVSNPSGMKRNGPIVALSLLVLLPALALAQLPTPTYGWNLGNTLEPPSGEGTWGPAANQATINAVADAGFNVIRLPVAWDSHANQSTYQIDPAWMARVKQVVDWCYAKNLTVIVNCHWDGGWLENNITDTVNPTINAKMQSYWTQIATAFAGYDNRLLFAGANEPNCDTAAEWSTLRSYYNTFISAVRATGGNNATRWLVVQGPNTNIDLSYDLVTTLPSDSTPGRLVFEVHHYPYQWTIMTQDADWGKMFYFWGQGYHSPTMLDRNSTWGEEAYTDEQFGKMATKFVNNGVPVIIGEWGAVKRTGYPDLTGTELNRHLASRTYFSKYVTEKANALGLKPIWWDAGGTGSNTMWLFDRTTAAMIDPDNVNALTGGPALPPPSTGTILQQNSVGGGTKGEAKNGATLSQSFVHPGSGTYQVTKLTLHVSRKAPSPTANLVVYLGTAHAGGAIAGASVSIPPSAVTNTSNGNNWQTLDVVFTAPVTLNKGTTYYLNVTSATANNKPYYIDVSATNTYSGGTYSGGSRDMWFQVWGQ